MRREILCYRLMLQVQYDTYNHEQIGLQDWALSHIVCPAGRCCGG